MKFKLIDIAKLWGIPEDWKPNYEFKWQNDTMAAPRIDEVMVFARSGTVHAISRLAWLDPNGRDEFSYDQLNSQWMLHEIWPVQVHWSELKSTFDTINLNNHPVGPGNWQPNYQIIWQKPGSSEPRKVEVMLYHSPESHSFLGLTKEQWIAHKPAEFSYHTEKQEWFLYNKPIYVEWQPIATPFRVKNTLEKWDPNYAITWQDPFMEESITDEVMVYLLSDGRYYGSTQQDCESKSTPTFCYSEFHLQWLRHDKLVRAKWREL